jgi:hypothetical protein
MSIIPTSNTFRSGQLRVRPLGLHQAANADSQHLVQSLVRFTPRQLRRFSVRPNRPRWRQPTTTPTSRSRPCTRRRLRGDALRLDFRAFWRETLRATPAVAATEASGLLSTSSTTLDEFGMLENLIFVSCGQATDEEKSLGLRIKDAIERMPGFQAYFAEAVHELDALGRHVFDGLLRCSGAVVVLHDRGPLADREGLSRIERVRTRVGGPRCG